MGMGEPLLNLECLTSHQNSLDSNAYNILQ